MGGASAAGRGDGVVTRSGSAALLVVAAALASAAAGLARDAGPLRRDPGQLFEIETAYQTVRVIEAEEPAVVPGPDGPLSQAPVPGRVRFLRFDEDATSYQSVQTLGGDPAWLTSGRYYDHLALGLWFTGQPWARASGSAPAAPRVLIVGYAGGTLDRTVRAVAPAGAAPDVTGVELDPAVWSAAGRGLAGADALEAPRRLLTGEDGRTVVDALPEDDRYDLIAVDAYQRTQYVPFQLATVEFFRACARRLSPSGVVGVNVNQAGGVDGPLLRALAATFVAALEAEGGGAVWIVSNPLYPGNFALWGSRSTEPPRVAARAPRSLAFATFALERLLVRHVPGVDPGEVWTDDRAPTERTADRDALREASEDAR